MTAALVIPTVGIGAGRTPTPGSCRRTSGHEPGRARFVERYADLGSDPARRDSAQFGEGVPADRARTSSTPRRNSLNWARRTRAPARSAETTSSGSPPLPPIPSPQGGASRPRYPPASVGRHVAGRGLVAVPAGAQARPSVPGRPGGRPAPRPRRSSSSPVPACTASSATRPGRRRCAPHPGWCGGRAGSRPAPAR